MSPTVTTGLDNLIETDFELLRGKRIGAAINQTSATYNLRHIVDVLTDARIDLKSLFALEHGVRGDVQDGVSIESFTDTRTGILINSLYGKHKSPTAEMLADIDSILFDIQDIGCRYYTFIWSMVSIMESCAKFGKEFIVLDRPNPTNGINVEGNIPNPYDEFRSFVGLYPVPIRHGLTTGELAHYINEKYSINADLKIVPCRNLERWMWFDDTGLQWIPTSPNMPDIETAILYPGICLIEGTNISEGRGTTTPFKIVGAPWIDSQSLVGHMNSLELPGLLFRETRFIPKFSKYTGIQCNGLQIHITNRDLIHSVNMGLYLLDAIHRMHPADMTFNESSGICHFDHLAGSDDLRKAIENHADISSCAAKWNAELKTYRQTISDYHLY